MDSLQDHAVENIELLEDADVKNFVGEYEPERLSSESGVPDGSRPLLYYRLLYGSKA